MKIIKIILKIVFFPLKILVLGAIYFYKFCISPLLPKACIYTPTCSTYMIQSIKKFGLFKGVHLGLKRISRCSPGHNGGIDRVKEDIKGDFKWLI